MKKNELQVVLLALLVQVSVGIEIVANPSSLLVPVNEVGAFTCKARCHQCTGNWIVNDSFIISESRRDQLIGKGFRFLEDRWNGDELTMMLTVNASEAVNNTNISCEFDPNGDGDSVPSARATLLVISNSPLADNPALAKNTTHATVMWSPPFLWPGRAIEYYLVTFVNHSDGSNNSRRVNSTFSDHVLSYAKQMPGKILHCTAFSFCISAADSSGPLESFNIISSSPGIEFPSMAINSSVLYKSDGIPALLEVNIQLPDSMCDLNYTLLVEDERDNVVKSLGPFLHVGSSVVKQVIVITDLKGNREYSLKAQAGLHSQVAESNKHYFSTLLKKWDTNTNAVVNQVISVAADENSGAYKAATGVSLAIAIVMLLAMVFVIVSVYFWHKYRGIDQRCQESKQRVCQTMVPNPIYDGDGEGDGPVYDSVRPQYETLVAVAPARFTETQQGSSVTELSHNNDADVVRYVDPPIQLPQFRSQSFAHTIADIDGGSASRSYSVSLPPPRVMALKKNGEERNKLHLTLSLGESEASHDNMEAPPVPTSSRTGAAVVPVDPTEPMDESYMVMNSASVLSNLKSSVGHKPQNDA